MISVKCPHCHVGLKVDEGKIPLDITSFKCPKCRQPIPVSLLSMEKGSVASESETVLIQPFRMTTGHLSVIANADTPEQTFPLQEGVYIIGRKSKASTATIGIVTADKSMSREHIRIEVKKDAKGGYKHYLSDNNSKNHTLYNSNYLENGEIVVLNNNDEIIIDDFASATAIRKMIATGQFSDIQKVMPKSSYALLADELRKGHYVLDLSKFQKEIIYNLRKMSVEEIAQLVDVSEGLENAIKNAANSSNNLVDFVNIVKSKRYTQTRIQRILIYALLGITNSKMLAFKKAVPYARVLGFNENGKQLISQIAKKNKKVQIVTSVKKYMDESKNKVLKEMLETDILATNVYTLGYEKDSWSNLDYTNKLVTM